MTAAGTTDRRPFEGQAVDDPAAFARRIATRTYPDTKAPDIDDLTQEAWLGIVSAIDTWDPTKGRSLDSWCWLYARGRMHNWWIKDCHTRDGSVLAPLNGAHDPSNWTRVSYREPGFGQVDDRDMIARWVADAGLSDRQLRVLGWMAVHGTGLRSEFGRSEFGPSGGSGVFSAAASRLRRVAAGCPPSNVCVAAQTRAVLSWELVDRIHAARARGATLAEIGQHMPVAPRSISDASRGVTWTNDPRPLKEARRSQADAKLWAAETFGQEL